MVLGPQQIEKATITNLTTMNAFSNLPDWRTLTIGEKKIFPKQYFSSDGDSQLVLEQTNIGNFLTKWLFICPFFPHFLPVIEDLVYKMNFI